MRFKDKVKYISKMGSNETEVIKNYKHIINRAHGLMAEAVTAKSVKDVIRLRLGAATELEKIVKAVDVTDYLLIDSTGKIPKTVFLDCLFQLGSIYKSVVETEVEKKTAELQKNELRRHHDNRLSKEQEEMLIKSLEKYKTILAVVFEDQAATKQIVSVYTRLSFFYQHDYNKVLQLLHEALLYSPGNEIIHYNLGFVYQKLNKLEMSVIHYKTSLELIAREKQKNLEIQRMILNNYNGISGVYRSIKKWPEALHYLLKAIKAIPTDPDILNQLGVVYTEMRRTDLAEEAYKKAIRNYKSAFISTDTEFLLAEIHLNLGHMHSYNGDNIKSIECYNKSLGICPKFHLPFQNKIMNLSYIFDELEDKKYIYQQHRLVNKIYAKGNGMFQFDENYSMGPKTRIGIVSGDFVDHPVSFFIGTFLRLFDSERFEVTCYSECVINTKAFNPAIQFKLIKGMSAESAATLIHNDRIHILIDLAGHTAFNRLDVFALKPCPKQVTYIGYPYSTGLDEMDYRITDSICDKDSVSSAFYSEKLICMNDCFLCYDPLIPRDKLPQLSKIQPINANGYLTIGCFNRLNKMTDSVIKWFNEILKRNDRTRFIFKTKALLNKRIVQAFIKKFDESVRNRIQILDCTILHEAHLLEYNKVDIALDTFPYSGTTTSCEALLMGVPVFTVYDKEYYFHPQNVTASILKNSGMDYYVLNSVELVYDKIVDLMGRGDSFWAGMKRNSRDAFLNGKVCNKSLYMKNLHNILEGIHNGRF